MARHPEHALTALYAYPAKDVADMRTSIIDLMADLMHLATENKMHPAEVVGTAERHFVAEHQAHVEAEREKEAARG